MKIKSMISEIDDLDFKEALEYFARYSRKQDQKRFVVSINTEIVMLARKDSEFESILRSADLALNDGVGVSWAAQMLGRPLKGRVHGSDLVEEVCEAVAGKPITVGFLGGKQNVAERAAKCLSEKYPGLKVAFSYQEQPSKLSELKSDILFVAFGSPKQEKWIANNLKNLPIHVVMGVGGTFDYISGNVSRAPVWVRNLGLEWVFRLIRQPWRIRRQSALIRFVIVVISEKLGL
jgi:N-acetylglucosaminyldiphosphoundecaprenol N-acetyl-beta-D-mannosaminyltransferase